ncbi:MAG TPA: helix-hairpin-helix domain-containing protein [archaeon]|nr:helix-hairpin-helix domain-containing protein [archaeon]
MRLKLAREGPVEGLTLEPAAEDSAVLRLVEKELEARKLPIDVNRADQILLQRVEGIGPRLAGRIIAEREAHGPFRDAHDLADRVDGIGEVTVQRLARQLAFGDTTSGRRQ